jgi:hypothetical protein
MPLTIAPLEIPECEEDQLVAQHGLNTGGISSKQEEGLEAAIRQAEVVCKPLLPVDVYSSTIQLAAFFYLGFVN